MKILKTFCILLIFFLFFQNHSLASSSQQVDKISKNLRSGKIGKHPNPYFIE